MTVTQQPLTAPVPELAPIRLDTPRDYQLLRIALEARAADIEKVAKKADDESYPKEARIMRGDAARITEDILPMIREQTEIPLATADEVRAGIVNEIRQLVRQHVKESDERTDHEAVMLEYLGERIERFARDVANRAFSAGVAYRESDPAVFAIKSLASLRHAPKAG